MAFMVSIGAQPVGEQTRFRVWAPQAQRVDVQQIMSDQHGASFPLIKDNEGFFEATLPLGIGTRYMYRIDNGDPRPDPASRFQPEGVHGPSEVVDASAFRWSDDEWRGVPLNELVIYELHVGTATPEGTFDAIIDKLNDIRDLGITAIELMPVADFPGTRNWGYDGVNLFAPSRAYGGPEGLRRLVDAAHGKGLAVLLDVVYNHFGPDGNYLREFSTSYFTHRHTTPWGDALNMDGPESRPVRDFFVANVLMWAHEFHLDGLRLDATHAIIDDSRPHILSELATRVHESLAPDRHFLLIAENESNDPNLVRPIATGGMGLDGVWSDDFHHEVRVAITGEQEGYYADYSGSADDLAQTLRSGWFYSGQPSGHLGRPRGAPVGDLDTDHFVFCIQNHDQVGNRALGERLHHEIGLDAYRAASVLLLLSPYTPLIWMGQEWAASSPFLFFTDHNEELGRLVTEGRCKEFAGFTAFSGETVPDPQAEDTFVRSKLPWDERETPPHSGVLQLYRDLLRLRHEHPALRDHQRETFSVATIGDNAIALRRAVGNEPPLLVIVGLGAGTEADLGNDAVTAPPDGHRWRVLFDSEDPRYNGDGEPALSADGTTIVFNGARALVLEVAK